MGSRPTTRGRHQVHDGDFYSWLPLNPTSSRASTRGSWSSSPSRVRGVQFVPELPVRRPSAGAAGLREEEPEHRRCLGVDPGRWALAGRADVAVPEDRLRQLYDLDVYATGLAGTPMPTSPTVNRRWIAQNVTTTRPPPRRSRRSSRSPGRWPRRACTSRRTPISGCSPCLEPPPMMWISSGTSSAWRHRGARRDPQRVPRPDRRGHHGGAQNAQAAAEEMLAKAKSTIPGVEGSALRDRLIHCWSTRPTSSRRWPPTVLRSSLYYDWVDTGDPAAWDAWEVNKAAYETAVAVARRDLRPDLDTPAIVLRRRGRLRARRADQVVAGGDRRGHRRHPRSVGVRAPRQGPRRGARSRGAGLWIGATRPWRLVGEPDRPRGARLLVWLMPAVLSSRAEGRSRAGCRGPICWRPWSIALFVLTARVLIRGHNPFCSVRRGRRRAVVEDVATQPRCPPAKKGVPLSYWYRFWTDEQFRNIYVPVSFALSPVAVLGDLCGDAHGARLRPAAGDRASAGGRGSPDVGTGGLMFWSGL